MQFNIKQLACIGRFYKSEHLGFDIANGEITFHDGFIPTEEEKQAAILAITKQEVAREIDDRYERKRQEAITSGAGMAMVYLLKAAEARNYQVDPNGSYPLLTASVNSGEATDLAAAATRVLGRESALVNYAATLEQERLTKKIAITNATTVEEVNAILQ